MTGRLTQRELRAVNEALAQCLAGEFEEKIASRIRWREGECF